MFGRATITLGIGPHSGTRIYVLVCPWVCSFTVRFDVQSLHQDVLHNCTIWEPEIEVVHSVTLFILLRI